jgi:exonuclease SbcD
MPQDTGLANGAYCGSLLQCDFGEAGQAKRVNIVDVAAGRKAQVRPVVLSSPKRLRNVGSHRAGVSLDELKALAPEITEDYVKIFVRADRPLPGLAEQVREIVPNAVDIVVERPTEEEKDGRPEMHRMSAQELFAAYHEAAYTRPPEPALLALFNRLYEEASGAPS